MKFIMPLAVTDSMVSAGTTVAEPAPSETVWVSAATYAIGDKRIRSTTHREYMCLQAHTGRTQTPETDTSYWQDIGPTLRMAPFDSYISTPATGTTSLTYVLQPGYFNAFSLYGLVGTNLTVTIKDAPGGVVIYSHSAPLFEDPSGWYEYLFVAPRLFNQFSEANLPIRPAAELTVTVSSATGQPVSIGMITLGDMVDLVGDMAEFGGTEYGATAEPMTYSYINTDQFGNTTITRRHRATGISASIVLPHNNADEALRQIQKVLDVPVAWIATDVKGYTGLNVFGLGSARLSYEPTVARLQLTVKGMI